MQTVAKVFIIIGMITGAIAILPLIFGFLALGKMKNGEMNTTWKILTLLFVSPIAGILLLLDK
ncbi:MAG: hypothetical protein IJP27_06175 [Clostridia bacterium]|nr:hypothetical protein [Clostridia bacterium]